MLFLWGLAIGSFLNVVIYRTVTGESPFKGRSKCDHCGRELSWTHNIPLLSYLVLRGRCVYCKKRIPVQYPLVELLTGLIFVWWFLIGQYFFLLVASPWVYIQPLFWLSVGILLWLVVVFDLRYGIIPDWLNGLLLVLVLGYRLALVGSGIMYWRDFVSMAVTAAAVTGFFLGLYLLSRRKGFGLGDVKLAPSIALLTGATGTVVAVFAAFLAGAVMAVPFLVLGRVKMKQSVPFGPLLVLGVAISLLWGEVIWGWYLSMLG